MKINLQIADCVREIKVKLELIGLLTIGGMKDRRNVFLGVIFFNEVWDEVFCKK